MGVQTLPDPVRHPDSYDQPVFVLLNAGIIHHVGPNRLHVRLARTLAEAGFPSFRFDLAGIGDSLPLGTSDSVNEEHLQSVKLAFDALESKGFPPRFVLFGLCSGATLGFQVTSVDPRVVGLVFVDPPAMLRTWRYYVVRGLDVLKRPRVWVRFLLGRYGVLKHLRGGTAAALNRQRDGRGQPSRTEAMAWAERALKSMLERDVRLFLVVTGSLSDRYNYRHQFSDLFPSLGLDQAMRIEFSPGARHTFPREESRQRLMSAVLDWLQTRPFP